MDIIEYVNSLKLDSPISEHETHLLAYLTLVLSIGYPPKVRLKDTALRYSTLVLKPECLVKWHQGYSKSRLFYLLVILSGYARSLEGPRWKMHKTTTASYYMSTTAIASLNSTRRHLCDLGNDIKPLSLVDIFQKKEGDNLRIVVEKPPPEIRLNRDKMLYVNVDVQDEIMNTVRFPW